VFLYIQNSEAAIRGFLPKNTNVEKTERVQEIFNSTNQLTDKNEEIYRSTSLGAFQSSFAGFDSQTDKNRPLRTREIFGRRRTKKFGASSFLFFFLLQWLFIDHTNTFLQFQPKRVMSPLTWNGERPLGVCPFVLLRRPTERLKQGQQEEGDHHCIMLFGRQATTQPCTLSDTAKRRSLAL